MTAPPPETLDLIYRHLRGAPERRIADGQRQEAKAVSLFAAATVLLGLAGVSQPHAAGFHWLVILLSALAAVAYGIAIGATVFTLWPRTYRAADYDTTLWRQFWSDKPEVLKHAVVADITEGAPLNREANARRELGVYWVLGATAAEGLLVAAVLILVRVVLG